MLVAVLAAQAYIDRMLDGVEDLWRKFLVLTCADRVVRSCVHAALVAPLAAAIGTTMHRSCHQPCGQMLLLPELLFRMTCAQLACVMQEPAKKPNHQGCLRLHLCSLLCYRP